MCRATPARLGVGRAGTRYTTAAMLAMRADHARAVDAVRIEVPAEWPARSGFPELHTRAPDRETYLRRPDLGRMLADDEAERLAQRFARRERLPSAARAKPSAVILIGDGLSSSAVRTNAAPLVRALKRKLGARYRIVATIFIRNARVRVVHHERNRGYGGAVRSGLMSSRKKFLFYTDGDRQFHLDDLARLVGRQGDRGRDLDQHLRVAAVARVDEVGAEQRVVDRLAPRPGIGPGA